jgi:hypothetical protein
MKGKGHIGSSKRNGRNPKPLKPADDEDEDGKQCIEDEDDQQDSDDIAAGTDGLPPHLYQPEPRRQALK